MPFLRAVCRMTASLTGNTVPARSRAILYFGHSIILIDFVLPRCGLGPEPMCTLMDVAAHCSHHCSRIKIIMAHAPPVPIAIARVRL